MKSESMLLSCVLSPVKLYPPVNLTVQNGSDFNLWFYWNQSASCVESEVQFRINQNKWQVGYLFVCVLVYVFSSTILSKACFIFSRNLKLLLGGRVTASICLQAVSDMSCKCAAGFHRIVERLRGVNGASLWSGDPITAQVTLTPHIKSKGGHFDLEYKKKD